MSGPGPLDDGGEELLRAPRVVPGWVTVLVLAVVVLGIGGVAARRHTSPDPHSAIPKSVGTRRGTRSAAVPALVASDVLLPGRSGFSQDTPGRIVLGTSIRNTGPRSLTIRYPIVIHGPAHRTLPPLHVGVFSLRTAQSSAEPVSASDRLVRIGAGRTAELVLSLDVDCQHSYALKHWPSAPFRAVVFATPAVGAATFDLTNNDVAIPFQVRSACRAPGRPR